MKRIIVSLLFLLAPTFVWAQISVTAAIAERAVKRLSELQDSRIHQVLGSGRLTHLPSMLKAVPDYPAEEANCSVVHQLTLAGDEAEDFGWILEAASDAFGRCLGSAGIEAVKVRLDNALIEKGYVTSFVQSGAHDTAAGTLAFKLVVGRIGSVRFSEGSKQGAHLGALLPVKSGDILNVYALEHGLDNLANAATVSANISIVPTAVAGASDIEVEWRQAFPLRLFLVTDDSGTKKAGRYLGNTIVAYDNPLGFSDTLYLSFLHSIEGKSSYSTQSYNLYYILPFGYNKLTLSMVNYDYRMALPTPLGPMQFSGDNQGWALELSRVVQRNQSSRTTVAAGTFFTKSHNFLNGNQLYAEQRRIAGWDASLEHFHEFGHANLNGKLRVRHGTGLFHAAPAPEEAFDLGTSRATIYYADVRAMVPFKLGDHIFRYIGEWHQQFTKDMVIGRDRFSIGGRYNVRGYSGESYLAAENGFVMRNEIGYPFKVSGTRHEFYVGYDIGHVYGECEKKLPGQTLTGAVQGLRGAVKNFKYDLFIAHPLSHPAGFKVDDVVTGFNVAMTF